MENENGSKYSMETHYTQTEDGYFVTLLRVIESAEAVKVGQEKNPTILINDEDPNANKDCKPKDPILIVHGFMCSGDEWMLQTEGNVLPFILADQGYDVWIACHRGSRLSHSKPHISLRRGSRKFWDFSLDELGGFDVPAMIEYVLDVTAHKDLYYIGHSLGCTVFFVLMAQKPEYNSKVKAMVALTPAVYGKHVTNILIRVPLPLVSLMGKSKFCYQRELCRKSITGYSKAILPCNPKANNFGGWLFKKFGYWTEILGKKQLPKESCKQMANIFPGAASTKTFCHAVQCYYSGKFRAYDYGRTNNVKRYGQARPPLYDLKNITVPVATFTSIGDGLIPSEDVKQISLELPNLISHTNICRTEFRHGDFMIGKDANELVYKKIVQIFHDLQNKKGPVVQE